MTITPAEAIERLKALLDGLAAGSWTPGTPESTCAAVILTAPPQTPPADALVDGLRVAGPQVAPTGSLFAPALAQCAALLRSQAVIQSPDGQRMREVVEELMSQIIAATPPPSWARRLLQRQSATSCPST